MSPDRNRADGSYAPTSSTTWRAGLRRISPSPTDHLHAVVARVEA
jgi:hypothetical protein